MIGNAVLSRLFVRLNAASSPESGSFTFTVRVNGAGTALTCTLAQSGQCTAGAATVNVSTGDRVSIVVSNDFVGSGNMAYTYSLLLD